MAERFYGIDHGEAAEKYLVTEGAASLATTDVEVRVDLAAGLSKFEVLTHLQTIVKAIMEDRDTFPS